jgi:hypothetical protein
MPESTENNGFAGTSLRLKIGLDEMLKGGASLKNPAPRPSWPSSAFPP